jgi:hypothetical protein
LQLILPGRQEKIDIGLASSLLLRGFLETIAIRIEISVFANDGMLKLEPEVPHHFAKGAQVAVRSFSGSMRMMLSASFIASPMRL